MSYNQSETKELFYEAMGNACGDEIRMSQALKIANGFIDIIAAYNLRVIRCDEIETLNTRIQDLECEVLSLKD